MYTVSANQPSRRNLAWDYASDYFPRRFFYLKDARRCAEEAIAKGAKSAHIQYVTRKGRRVEIIVEPSRAHMKKGVK